MIREPQFVELSGDVIQITTPERKSIARRYPKLDDRIQVLSVDEVKVLPDTIHFRDSYVPGSVFIKHPFIPNTYISAATPEIDILRERLQCIGSIAQELGAYQYKYSVIKQEVSSREQNMVANLSLKAVKAKGKFKRQCKEVVKESAQTIEVYQGKVPEDAVYRAQELAKRFGLEHDVDVVNLINKASSQNRGRIIQTEIEATRGMDSTMDAVFSLKSMAQPFNVDVHVIENSQYKKRLKVKMSVSFDQQAPLFKLEHGTIKLT